MPSATEFRSVLLLGLCVVAGALIALGGLALAFPSIPNDVERARHLGVALDDATAPPSVVILGSSVVMNGVDASLVSEDLPGSPTVWNLGSTGQTLLEAALLLDRATAAPDVAVFTALPADLIRPGVTIPTSKYVAYRLYGYRTPDALRDAIPSDDPLAEVLDDNPVAIAARGRWIVRAFLDSGVRRAVRRDLDTDRALRDLTYPAPYTRPVGQAALDRQFRDSYTPRTAEEANIDSVQAAALGVLVQSARSRGTCPLVVILPEHPQRRATTDGEFYSVLSSRLEVINRQLNTDVVDLSDGLPSPGLFNDYIHPNAEGAERISRAIAQAIRSHCPESR